MTPAEFIAAGEVALVKYEKAVGAAYAKRAKATERAEAAYKRAVERINAKFDEENAAAHDAYIQAESDASNALYESGFTLADVPR